MSQKPSPQSPGFTRREALRAVALTFGATALPSAFGFLSPAARAASPSPGASSSAPPMVSSSLGGKFSLITGAGGNIAVLGGDDGVIVIDSGLPNLGARTAAEIAKSGRIALLVNTHWHPDHVGGNDLLAQAGAQIMAHENCRRRLSTEQFIEALDMKVPASAATAWPRVTFASETTLHLNGDEIRLVPVPPAHTDGDIIVHFEKADVIHAGDLFFNGRYPFIDYSTGGWIGGMIAGTKTLSAMTTSKTRIIPGHGPLATPEDLRGYLAFLETMLERFTKLKDEGRTVDEVVAAAPAKEFDEKLGKGFMKPEQFVRIAYTGLLKHQ
jgi:cyclase